MATASPTSASGTKFVYFDLGNVLLTFSHERACRQMSAVSGVPWETIWNLVFDNGLEDRYERGEITTQEFCEIFCRETKTNPPIADLLHAGNAIFEPNQPVHAIVAAMASSGIPLGVLSNTNESHWSYCIEKYTLLQNLPVRALSYELRSMKPARKIYEQAIERCGCAPGSIFFVDDRQENVTGARAAGIDAVHFSSPRQLVRDLLDRGLEFNL